MFNETPNINVYFDNLQVTQTRGHLLSEEGYYPFGLAMNALSSHAGAVTPNAYKYNSGTELTEDLDVDYYETYFRQYDAQVGRFSGVDSKAETYASLTPYRYSFDNPISYNDPSGAMEGRAADAYNKIVNYVLAGGSIDDINMNGSSVDYFFFGDGSGGGGFSF